MTSTATNATIKQSHTPGPWYFTASSEKGFVHGGKDHRVIVPHSVERNPDQEHLANARLIAAAPDLLQALQRVEHLARNVPVFSELMPSISAAIKKATTP